MFFNKTDFIPSTFFSLLSAEFSLSLLKTISAH